MRLVKHQQRPLASQQADQICDVIDGRLVRDDSEVRSGSSLIRKPTRVGASGEPYDSRLTSETILELIFPGHETAARTYDQKQLHIAALSQLAVNA
jgi:hypothetical protein